MIGDYLNDTGYNVTRAVKELYDDDSAATLTLTGTAPSVNYRLRITLSGADCAGTVTINGAETLTFTAAGKKVTTTTLTANSLPTVTTANLNCNILIECLDAGGSPIMEETQAAIYCRFSDTQKTFRDSAGAWNTTDAVAWVEDTTLGIGDVFSQGGYDYDIAQISSHDDLDGDGVFRKIYLTGRRAAPDDRAVTVPAGETVDITGYMLKSVYDTDNDAIADTAEGIREVTEFPASPKKGDMVLKDGEIYVCTGT